MENEKLTIEEVVATYKELIDRLMERQDQLEDLLFNQVLNPAKDAMNKFERDGRHNDFMEKHGETLSAFNDKLRAIEGEDFDLAEQAFEDYDSMEEKPESDVYVAALVAKVTEQIDKLKKAFGAENIEVKADEGEPAEIIADGEVVAEAAEAGTEEATEIVDEGVADEIVEEAPVENVEEKECGDEEKEPEQGEEVIDTDSEEYKKELEEFEKSLGL